MTPTESFLVGTSWKMNKTVAEARAYVAELVELGVPAGVTVFLLPPHTALAAVREALGEGSPVLVGAQNAHWADEGALTGEVSMRMVHEAGADLVEVGHSERRDGFGETDDDVSRKVAAALAEGLTPLVCVGEPLAVREAGHAEAHVAAQVRSALARVEPSRRGEVWFAYEPVWSIGEHGRPAAPDQVAPVVSTVRRAATTGGASSTTVLYGGGVDATNVAELRRHAGADGVFVGRHGWSAADLVRLAALCAEPSPEPVRV